MLMMKDRVFGHGTTSILWQSTPFRRRKLENIRKGKGTNKSGSTGARRAFLGEEQAHESELWSADDSVWWSLGKRGKKGFGSSQGNEGFRKGGFRTSPSEKGSRSDFINTKARAKIKKKAREVPVHRQDFQPLNTPLKRNKVLSGNQAIGAPIALTILQRVRGTIQDIRLGWHEFPWILPTIRRTLFWILVAYDQSEGSRNMRCIIISRQNSVTAKSLLCLPTLRQKLVGKVVLFIFRQNHNVLPGLMCLRRATCLSYSLPQMKNLGITLELDPKGAKITCPALHL